MTEQKKSGERPIYFNIVQIYTPTYSHGCAISIYTYISEVKYSSFVFNQTNTGDNTSLLENNLKDDDTKFPLHESLLLVSGWRPV